MFRYNFLACASLILSVCFLKSVDGTIIAKSDITICENTAKDPLNVLYNKRCEKKMVVLAEVTSGQGETEKLHATVNKVRDTVVGEDARLYNPFIITLSMSPVRLVYPIFYRGTLNNKPYEEMFPLETYSCSAKDHPCGAFYDYKDRIIWDSWGFCCECQRKGMYAMIDFYNFELKLNHYFRGQIDCDKYHSSAHCMRFDELWYDVHEIDVFTFDFSIWIKAYDQVERFENNMTIVDWVEGGEIELSPTKTGGVGKHGRIVAKYIGKMKAGREYPRLQDHFLMTPNAKSIIYGKKYHPQLRRCPLFRDYQNKGFTHGSDDYLIIPMSQVEINKDSPKCDVIGVSFTAFAQQSTFHGRDGYGCYQKEGTCLRNQIRDYFIEDTERRDRGERTKYFPETYGKITGLKERLESRDRVVEFESEETSSVMVYLEISADDLILVYNRAGGVIVKAFAEGFESQSRNGLATVMVQNTGFVTADFYVSLEYCSNGINGGNEKRASINPQTNHQFQFTLESYRREGGAFSCTANLYDARRISIDSSIISINTTSTCVCILRCGCSCTDQENFVCINESNVTFDQGKPPTYTDFMDSISDTLGMIFETVGDVASVAFSAVKGIWELLPHLDRVWSYLTLVFIIIALIIVRVLCGFLPTGVFKLLAKKTFNAMKSPDRERPAPTTVVVIQKDSDSEEDETKKTQEFLGASAEGDGQRRNLKDFIFEFFFIFIFPLMLLYKGLKPLWQKALGPCFSVTFHWLRKQLSRLFKTLWRLTKEKLPNKEQKRVSDYKSGDNRNIYDCVASSVDESGESTYVGDNDKTTSGGKIVSLLQKRIKWLFSKLFRLEKKVDPSRDVECRVDKDYERLGTGNESIVQHYGSECNKTEDDVTVSDIGASDVTGSNNVTESNHITGGNNVTGSDHVIGSDSVTGSDHVIGSDNVTGSNHVIGSDDVTGSDDARNDGSLIDISNTGSSGTSDNDPQSVKREISNNGRS